MQKSRIYYKIREFCEASKYLAEEEETRPEVGFEKRFSERFQPLA